MANIEVLKSLHILYIFCSEYSVFFGFFCLYFEYNVIMRYISNTKISANLTFLSSTKIGTNLTFFFFLNTQKHKIGTNLTFFF